MIPASCRLGAAGPGFRKSGKIPPLIDAPCGMCSQACTCNTDYRRVRCTGNYRLMEQLLDNALAGLGYELVDFSRSRGGMLRIIIDCEQGVALADCEQVSRHLENLLPVEGVAYERLEISSPGPTRPLTKPEHFTRFCGRKAQVKLRIACDGRCNYTGVIAAADEQGMAINCLDGVHRLGYSEIAKARLCDGFAGEEDENDN